MNPVLPIIWVWMFVVGEWRWVAAIDMLGLLRSGTVQTVPVQSYAPARAPLDQPAPAPDLAP